MVTAVLGLSAESMAHGSRSIDSLTTRLTENLHDTDRIKTLNELAVNLTYGNPDANHYIMIVRVCMVCSLLIGSLYL